MNSSSLNGLSIVVTRPIEQSENLKKIIQDYGGNVISFPLLEIKPVTDPRQLIELVSRITDFDLAVFISPNAVRFGMEAILAGGGLPNKLRIAAVGQSSAIALRNAGVSEVIVPIGQSDSESLLALPQLQQVQNWNTVIFRGDGGRNLLGDTLKARGSNVEYVTCYLRSKPAQDIEKLLKSKPDAFTISSSEALSFLWEMLDDVIRADLISMPLFVPHARIAEKARQLGWRNVIQTESGDDGLVSSLVTWSKAKL